MGGGREEKQENLRQELPFSTCLQPHPISLPHSLLPLPGPYPPLPIPPFPHPAPSSSALLTPLPPPPNSAPCPASLHPSALQTGCALHPSARPGESRGPVSAQERQVLALSARARGQRGNCRESPAQPHAQGILGALSRQTLASVYGACVKGDFSGTCNLPNLGLAKGQSPPLPSVESQLKHGALKLPSEKVV